MKKKVGRNPFQKKQVSKKQTIVLNPSAFQKKEIPIAKSQSLMEQVWTEVPAQLYILGLKGFCLYRSMMK